MIAASLLRAYSGIEVLALCRTRHAEMRLILIVNPIAGQHAAMAALASDYVMKGKVRPLVAAVLRPLMPNLDAERQPAPRASELDACASAGEAIEAIDSIGKWSPPGATAAWSKHLRVPFVGAPHCLSVASVTGQAVSNP